MLLGSGVGFNTGDRILGGGENKTGKMALRSSQRIHFNANTPSMATLKIPFFGIDETVFDPAGARRAGIELVYAADEKRSVRMPRFSARRSDRGHVAIQTGQLDHQLLEPEVVFLLAEFSFLISQGGDR
jgi:hypothetical protein